MMTLVEFLYYAPEFLYSSFSYLQFISCHLHFQPQTTKLVSVNNLLWSKVFNFQLNLTFYIYQWGQLIAFIACDVFLCLVSIFCSQEHIEGSFYIYLFLLHKSYLIKKPRTNKELESKQLCTHCPSNIASSVKCKLTQPGLELLNPFKPHWTTETISHFQTTLSIGTKWHGTGKKV